ncbi:Uncharacterized protein APZ42_014670 [Daphnia magna]|uniref:Uncharacterized protein n=1 Tax=Daphnia magna TaxID=35525 RepID=A0A162PPE9_9CRUS|nr:Uncharacterized protein APZ42_014670 [Daphnia magna]
MMLLVIQCTETQKNFTERRIFNAKLVSLFNSQQNRVGLEKPWRIAPLLDYRNPAIRMVKEVYWN